MKYTNKYKFFELSLTSNNIPKFIREYKFHEVRKWKIDFCWPDYLLAVEIEGGIWLKEDKQGRHNRGSGFIKDKEKYNELALKGFNLLRFTPNETRNGKAVKVIKQWFIRRNIINGVIEPYVKPIKRKKKKKNIKSC